MLKYLLIFLALPLELIGIVNFYSAGANLHSIAGLLVSCLIAISVISWAVLAFLPRRYRQRPLQTFMFLVTLQVCMPFIGSLGVITGICLPVWLPRKERQMPWKQISATQLPYRTAEISEQPIYSTGGLMQVLRKATDTNKRIKAVMATNQMRQRDAVNLLQHALSDHSDDVRLLAYARLDSIEKKISKNITEYLKELEMASGERSLKLKRQLADAYWEMSYLGLVSGSIRTHFLETAKKMLEEVFEHGRDGDALKFYGRILQALGLYEESTLSLYVALAKGIPRKQVLPYLAENLFYMKRYGQMCHFLKEYQENEPSRDVFYPIVDYWTKSSAAAVN